MITDKLKTYAMLGCAAVAALSVAAAVAFKFETLSVKGQMKDVKVAYAEAAKASAVAYAEELKSVSDKSAEFSGAVADFRRAARSNTSANVRTIYEQASSDCAVGSPAFNALLGQLRDEAGSNPKPREGFGPR